MPKPQKGPRLRKCAVCREPFQPRNMMHKVCGPNCAETHAEAIRSAQDRKQDRERKQALKTRQDWLREAQQAFNSYIRERDKTDPCISCGRFHDGSWDAGHYRSVGAAPALRFDENNVHKQCVPCNQHKGGNIVEYRLSLINKIGRIAVEWLETEQPPAKYTIEDAQRIKALYKQKLKELQSC
ncbi:MAG: recombination protein NinG [Alphaproteobacteria bacterium]|nr:recombination protein NinG [Alphaproteobacteria bacterium]